MAKAPKMYGCSFQPYPYLRCYARDWEAQKRYGQLCSVDKTNVSDVSQLWRDRETASDGDRLTAMATQYPNIELSHLYVDNAAMQLVPAPKQSDTIVTGNLFGDILVLCSFTS